MKEDLTAQQETAGFNEIEQRHALGSHFNHMFFWSILDSPAKFKVQEPIGKVKRLELTTFPIAQRSH